MNKRDTYAIYLQDGGQITISFPQEGITRAGLEKAERVYPHILRLVEHNHELQEKEEIDERRDEETLTSETFQGPEEPVTSRPSGEQGSNQLRGSGEGQPQDPTRALIC